MFKKMIAASAVLAAFAASHSLAQQHNDARISDQRIAQELNSAVGSRIYISTAGVRKIQQRLNQIGFDVGNVDGQWNSQTAQGVRNYQRMKGLEPTGTLTLALLNSLGMNELLSGEKLVQGNGQRWFQEMAVGEGVPLHISPAGVRQIQLELNKRGYDVGHVDGQWGKNTAKAAANFQQANGLEPNGKPDVALIAALGGTEAIFFGRRGQFSGGADMRWVQETASGPGVEVWASPATVRRIQQRLNQTGYDVGRVDGSWGEQTSQAVKNFQRKNGLEPTGTLTTSLLASLGYGNWVDDRIGGQASGGPQGFTQRSKEQGRQLQ